MLLYIDTQTGERNQTRVGAVPHGTRNSKFAISAMRDDGPILKVVRYSQVSK